jgi:histidine ammonia-lyase
VPIRVGESLALEDVVEVALGAEVELGSAASDRIGAARDVIERAVASNETVYGVTTGFGSLANQAYRTRPGRRPPARDRALACDGRRIAALA